MCQRLQIPGAEVEFVPQVEPARVGHGEVGLYAGNVAQHLQQAHAVHGATGTGDGHHDAALQLAHAVACAGWGTAARRSDCTMASSSWAWAGSKSVWLRFFTP